MITTYMTGYIVLLVITAFTLKNCLYTNYLEDFLTYMLIWFLWPVTLLLWVVWYLNVDYVYVDTLYEEFIDRRGRFINQEDDPMDDTAWVLVKRKKNKWLYNNLDTLVSVKVNDSVIIIKEV